MKFLRPAAKVVFATTDLFLTPPTGPRLLIYHQIGKVLGRQMEVTTNDFEWQLDWLVEHRDVVELESALSRWEEPNADRLVVLTFDDGYLDTYTTAYPALRERSMPFTMYLETQRIEHGSTDGIPGLTWREVEKMMESGLATVGVHTHSHADLRQITEQQIVQELETSNSLIEGRLGVSPTHFAYPWGYWSSVADPTVRKLYMSAVLGAPSMRQMQSVDMHMLHRFPVQLSDGRRWFRARLKGGLLVEEAVRRRVRGYQGP